MEFRGQIYNTLKEWQEAENLAHKTCSNSKNYTSKKYLQSPIETTKNQFILVELKGFENELKKAGFEFKDLDKSIIKVEVID